MGDRRVERDRDPLRRERHPRPSRPRRLVVLGLREAVGHFSGCSLDQLKDLVTEATERLKEVQLRFGGVRVR